MKEHQEPDYDQTVDEYESWFDHHWRWDAAELIGEGVNGLIIIIIIIIMIIIIIIIIIIMMGRGGANWGWCEWSNQSCGGRVRSHLPIIKPFPRMRNLNISGRNPKESHSRKRGYAYALQR